ncbi:MAG: hypothetical protein SGILL_003274, partial [Bacillariaceae sp.]
MESTSEPGKIQVSRESADLLFAAGYKDWLSPRGKMQVKGKGVLDTFWLDINNDSTTEQEDSIGSMEGLTKGLHISQSVSIAPMQQDALIDWNTESLLGLLKRIVAYRKGRKSSELTVSPRKAFGLAGNQTYTNEVAEIIKLSKSSSGNQEQLVQAESVDIDLRVVAELRLLVRQIASSYNDNPFHNFEHASHVTMSILKLLSRIVRPSGDEMGDLADHSYGITADPLTHFACAFIGLIHDANHPGVSNGQLVKENESLGRRFGQRSVAEQNSLNLSFQLLASHHFKRLRAVLFANDADQFRFRQLIVNGVMATDIFDKDLKALRDGRWNAARKWKEEGEAITAQMVAKLKATDMALEATTEEGSITITHAEYYLCNVCQNSNNGYRYLGDPDGESFVNPASGDTWTCGMLQDAVQDVDPTTNGAAGEARLCYIYQIYAEQHCTCNGPEVPSLFEEYEEINAPCNLCEGYELNYVPAINDETTVDTSMFGNQNCLGLYEAALEGDVLDDDMCDSVWADFEPCCSLPELPESGSGSSNGESSNGGTENGGNSSSGSGGNSNSDNSGSEGSNNGSGGSDGSSNGGNSSSEGSDAGGNNSSNGGSSNNGGSDNDGSDNSGGGSSSGGDSNESNEGNENKDNDNPDIVPILTFVGAVVGLTLLNALLCF